MNTQIAIAPQGAVMTTYLEDGPPLRKWLAKGVTSTIYS